LRLVTADLAQKLELAFGLDALGQDPLVKLLAESNDHAHQSLVLFNPTDARDERPIDFDLAHRQGAKTCQRAVALAEIVEHQLDLLGGERLEVRSVVSLKPSMTKRSVISSSRQSALAPVVSSVASTVAKMSAWENWACDRLIATLSG
jgi:hypothetical protein